MKSLCPVKWQIEPLSPSGCYAFAWGGGLPETVTTAGHDTQEAALADLRIRLKKIGRCPDPALCNERTEGGRALLSVLQ